MRLPEPEPDQPHPSRETAGRFPDDQRIRRSGKFRIASRPARGEATWTHVATGEPYTTTEAIALLDWLLTEEGTAPRSRKNR